jgi:tetratricopeptide (TPR) repeat protein
MKKIIGMYRIFPIQSIVYRLYPKIPQSIDTLCLFGAWRKIIGLLFCVIYLGLWTNNAWGKDVNRSVAAYKQGYTLFSKKMYKQAIPFFEEAQQYLPNIKRYDRTRAALDLLIGTCLYHLNQNQAAHQLLTRYLQSPHRQKSKIPEAEEMLKELRQRISPDKQKVTHPKTPLTQKDPPPAISGQHPLKPPPKPSRWNPHPTAWVIASIGLVTLASALITGIIAQQNMSSTVERYERLKTESIQPLAQGISISAREAFLQSTVANILYISGGVLTSAGTIMLFTWQNTQSDPPPTQ